MRTALLAAALTVACAAPALAQPAGAGPIDPRLRETAGCAAVYLTMAQLSANPQMTGDDPLVGALAGAFGRQFTVKGRALYADAAEQARRQRLPPEAAFEAGVGYLIETFVAARARSPGGQLDVTTEAARLVERCVTAFPDSVPEF